MHAKTIIKQTLVMQISFFKIGQSSLYGEVVARDFGQSLGSNDASLVQSALRKIWRNKNDKRAIHKM